jgi:hypothetical protein
MRIVCGVAGLILLVVDFMLVAQARAGSGTKENRAAIAAAGAALEKQHLDMKDYNASVSRDGGALVISFTSRDAPEGARGSAGSRPGYEVELDPASLEVLRAHFIR